MRSSVPQSDVPLSVQRSVVRARLDLLALEV
jgi:hypothetical protein